LNSQSSKFSAGNFQNARSDDQDELQPQLKFNNNAIPIISENQEDPFVALALELNTVLQYDGLDAACYGLIHHEMHLQQPAGPPLVQSANLGQPVQFLCLGTDQTETLSIGTSTLQAVQIPTDYRPLHANTVHRSLSIAKPLNAHPDSNPNDFLQTDAFKMFSPTGEHDIFQAPLVPMQALSPEPAIAGFHWSQGRPTFVPTQPTYPIGVDSISRPSVRVQIPFIASNYLHDFLNPLDNAGDFSNFDITEDVPLDTPIAQYKTALNLGPFRRKESAAGKTTPSGRKGRPQCDGCRKKKLGARVIPLAET
jgi:hypothetical protein